MLLIVTRFPNIIFYLSLKFLVACSTVCASEMNEAGFAIFDLK